ncbi:unnamed protein product, partial [marine sediment metagenome]
PDMFAIHTIHNYLSDVANAAIIQQKMEKEEALKASQKGVIGLSNLEPRGYGRIDDKEFIKKIYEWNFRDDVYDGIFEGCGFSVLWVNRLMRIWNPDIPLEKDLPKDENRKYHCYHWFNSKDQRGPCWDCPCLYLYGKYLLAETEEKRQIIADSIEVRPSYSPAGEMQIYRHFELAAALILNEFAPKDAAPEDNISFIRETVIDRTLEVEVLAILTDEPEGRERVREGGELLPRQMEKELCQSVGNMLGLMLHLLSSRSGQSVSVVHSNS